MRKTTTLKLPGLEVSTQQHPATRGFTLLTRLAKTLGPVLGALGNVQDAGADLMSAELAPVLAAALQHVDAAEAASLMQEVLVCSWAIVTEKGQKPRKVDLTSQEDIDSVFDGRLLDLFRAVAHAIGANFADFIGGLAPSEAEATTAAES